MLGSSVVLPQCIACLCSPHKVLHSPSLKHVVKLYALDVKEVYQFHQTYYSSFLMMCFLLSVVALVRNTVILQSIWSVLQIVILVTVFFTWPYDGSFTGINTPIKFPESVLRTLHLPSTLYHPGTSWD